MKAKIVVTIRNTFQGVISGKSRTKKAKERPVQPANPSRPGPHVGKPLARMNR